VERAHVAQGRDAIRRRNLIDQIECARMGSSQPTGELDKKRFRREWQPQIGNETDSELLGGHPARFMKHDRLGGHPHTVDLVV
jgi:hypothetical protein